MTATLVPTTKTSCSKAELIEGFIKGWKIQFGELPKKESIGVLYAQNTLETGGTVSMWNWNIGNIKYVPSNDPTDDNDKSYMMLANVWEIVNGKKIIFQPPSKATWFRAFPTLADGIAFHLDFLKNHRYKKAWSAVESGNPAAFAHLLRIAGYYTAPESDYVRLMNGYFNQYMKTNIFEQAIIKFKTPIVINIPKPVPIPNLNNIPVIKEPIQIPIEPILIIDPIVPAPIKLSIWQKIQRIFS
jgi:hypothetical protein